MGTILLVGAEHGRIGDVRSLLRQDRHRIVVERAVDSWRAREHELQPDLIVAATDSEGLLLAGRDRRGRGFPAPILFVRNDADFSREPHLDERLVDQIAAPFLGEELLGRVDALIRVRRIIRRDPGSRAESARSRDGGASWWGRLGGLFKARELAERPVGPALEVAARVADWADRRDAFQPGHAERVASVCASIAEAMQLGEGETRALLRAAALHDIGKIVLPHAMLHQAAPLEDGQRRLIETHPRRGAELIRALDRNDVVARTILYHHERPNGSGYYGVEGERIPRTAHILAVAEVYDAMTNSTLGKPMQPMDALAFLREQRGEIHDAESVDALVDRVRPRPNTIALSRPVP